MSIYCKGEAIVKHRDTGEIFRIDADDLYWEQVSADEGGMGAEIGYEASIEHEELGNLTWNLQEYPIGIEDYRSTNVNGHTLLKDLEFGLESRDEFDFQDAFEEIVEWFHENFEDPANQTPHDSSEGGYIYIWGGPYDAHEVISEHFDSYPEEVIAAAVRNIEKDGTVDWAPKDGTPFHNGSDEDELFNENLIEEVSKEQLTEKLIQQVSELQALIQPIIKTNPGIGHNNPPEGISDSEIPYKEFEELGVISEELKVIAKKQLFESDIFNKVLEKLKTISTTIKNWILERLKKAIEKSTEAAIILGGDYLVEHGHEIIDKIVNIADSVRPFLH